MEPTAAIDLIDKWTIVFAVVAAIGVVGGGALTWLRWPKARALHALEVSENLSLQKEIASLEAAAAEANLERAQLEERLKPRVLSQPERLASAVSPFHEEKMFIVCDTDQQPIAAHISNVLFSSNWTKGVGFSHSEQRRLPPGMTLFVSPDAPQQTLDAANALAKGLVNAGITDLVGPIAAKSPDPTANANSAIVLMIGAKR